MQFSSLRIHVNPKRCGLRPLWAVVGVVAGAVAAALAGYSLARWAPGSRAVVQAAAPTVMAAAEPARSARPARGALSACRPPSADSPATPAAAEAAKAAAAAVPGPAIQLVGTVVERDLRYAFLRTNDGGTRMAKIGDVIAGAELTAVTRQDATVRFQGRSYTLALSAPSGSPASAGPGGRTPGGESGRQAAVLAILEAHRAARDPAAAPASATAREFAGPMDVFATCLAPTAALAPAAGPVLAQAPAAAGGSDAAQPAPKFDRNMRQKVLPLLLELRAQVAQGRTVRSLLPAGDPSPAGNP